MPEADISGQRELTERGVNRRVSENLGSVIREADWLVERPTNGNRWR